LLNKFQTCFVTSGLNLTLCILGRLRLDVIEIVTVSNSAITAVQD